MWQWAPGSRVEFLWGDTFVCEPDWSWRIRRLPHLDLWYVIDGVAWVESAGRRTPIRGGDCLLLRPGHSYAAGHDPKRPLRLLAVHFEVLDGNGGRATPPEAELPRFLRHMEAGPVVRDLLARAIESYRNDRRTWASAWLQAALMEVLRQDAQSRPPGLAGEQAHRIQAICDQIRRQPGRPVRVDDLAEGLNMTPEHLCRIFRRHQGVSPRAFITQTRIDAARTLLLKSNHSIARIAELLGYESPFYFSRHFKAKAGVAPSVFRKGA